MDSDCDRTRVDLIRHGEHVLADAICGITDPDLSARGWQQLESQCRRLIDQGESWDICISSPRKRCAHFAEQLCRQLALELIVEDGFAEVDFGQWEGLSFAELNRSCPGEWQSWVENPAAAPLHGGEGQSDFLDRIQQTWNSLFDRYQGRRILLFSHGGVIRAIFADLFGLDARALLRFNVPYACHSRIIAYHMVNQPNWFQLDSHNSLLQ